MKIIAEPADLAVVGMRVMWDVQIPMDDGIALRANVYLPPEEGSYPTVMAMTDYAKDLPFSQGYAPAWKIVVEAAPDAAQNTSAKYISFEAPDPEKWVIHGYCVVIVDSRGVGGSPGVVDSLSAREADDYALAVDWVGEQPWSDGNVGLLGMSYLGAMQWLCASRQPKSLKAIIPWMAFDDQLRQLGYNGGIPGSFFKPWSQSQVRSVQNGQGRRGPRNEFTGRLVTGEKELTDEELRANLHDIYQQVMQHPLDDGFYDSRRANWDNVTVPVLSVTAWAAVGVHLRGNVEGFMNAATDQKWLDIRTEHGTYAALYEDAGVELQRRFFDCFLKGEGDFASQRPRVSLVVRDVNDEPLKTRSECEWPLPSTQWTKLYLDPQGAALSADPAIRESATTYDATGAGVTFRTPPHSQDTEILGPLAAKLWISASTPDADLFLSVRVFDETGGEKFFHGMPDPRMPLTQGWIRASQRELDEERSRPYRPWLTHTTVKPLWPGDIYELDVEIWPTSLLLPAGYTLGLTILGRDFDHGQEGSPWPGTSGIEMRGSSVYLHDQVEYRPAEVYDNEVTIHGGGDHASYLLLPIIPRDV